MTKPCENCGGDGWKDGADCTTCKGTGAITVAPPPKKPKRRGQWTPDHRNPFED